MVVIAEGVLGIDVYQFGIGVFLFFIGSAVIGFIIAFLILLFPDKKYQKAVSFLNEIKNFENE